MQERSNSNDTPRPNKTSIVSATALAVLMLVGSTLIPATGNSATATTRLEEAVATAAGRAAASAADRAVAHAVLNGAARYRGPACAAGANSLHLRGYRYVMFMAECHKIL
jgi:hypothetical protein